MKAVPDPGADGSVRRLLARLLDCDVQIWAEGEEIVFRAPQGATSAALRAEIRRCKPDLVAFLGQRRKHAPLSFAQERLWFLEEFEPANPAYNVHAAFRLRGRLRVAVLARALGEILRRHETLRTTFTAIDGRPVQVVDLEPPARRPMPAVVDLGGLDPASREAVALGRAGEDARRRFDLETEPLFRPTLIRIGGQDHLLLLAQHHIVSDGWSQEVLQRELTTLYEAFLAGSDSPLPELPLQYADFAVRQRRALRGEVLAAQLAYWQEQLGDDLPPLSLPTDRPRPAVFSYHGAEVSAPLPGELTGALRQLGVEAAASLFMVLLAAFMGLLHRTTGQRTIVVGSPIANRNRADVEGLIGFFVNSLVLRGDLGGNPTFRELLHQVRETALGAYAHQDLPFERLVEERVPERDMGRHPLFQTVLAVQNAPRAELRLGGCESSELELPLNAVRFDLELHFWTAGDRLPGVAVYNTDLFDRTTIARLMGHLATLLAGAVADRRRRLAELPLLSPAEAQQVMREWNATAAIWPRWELPGGTLGELFAVAVERRPDAVAVIVAGREAGGDRVLSYRELNARANQVAHHLRSLGVGPEIPVGIAAERGPELVVGLCGILKAGGVCLPLDPALPAERLAFMLRDAGARVLLVCETVAASLPAPGAHRAQVAYLDGPRAEARAGAGTENPKSPPRPDNLAYVIYTSGTTGVPKGVAVSHRQVLPILSWSLCYFPIDDHTRVLQTLSHCFDFGLFELLTTLLGGGTLCFLPAAEQEDPCRYLDAIARHRLNTVHATPSFFRQLMRPGRGLAGVEIVHLGGEALSRHLVHQIRAAGERCRVYNGYGPTEAAINSAIFALRDPAPDHGFRGGTVPIGRMTARSCGYVVDRYQRALPVGVPGELAIGGEGLARGYLNRPALTAERFLPDPFARTPGQRLYRTGDLVRWLPAGNLDFLGRIDHQVKIRGFRLELGEVAAVLSQHPAVREAVALMREPPGGGERRLVAFVVLDPAPGPAPQAGELREFLLARLPEYMVPAAFVVLAALPRSATGKIDRTALCRLPLAVPEWRQLKSHGVAPRSPLEEAVASIWAEVLGVDRAAGEGGVHDNFFELGGHSLVATQVVSRLRQTFRVELPVRRLFECPTVAELAQAITAGLAAPAALLPPLRPVPRRPRMPVSFAQQRLWFLHQLVPASAAYNMPEAHRLTGALEVGALEAALRALVRRHETLRTTFQSVEGEPYQAIASTSGPPLAVVDLVALAAPARRHEASRQADEEAGRPFDLARGPVMRVFLLRLAPQEHVLVINVHHIVSDGWSRGVFHRELGTLYQIFCGRSAAGARLPELPIQYADFALWQREWLRAGRLEALVSYWRRQLGENPPLLRLPTDRPRPAVQTDQGSYRLLELPASLSRALRRLALEAEVSLFMVLVAAFMALLHRYSGQQDVVVGSPIANRNHREIEGLIGFFVNTLVLRGELSARPTIRQLLGRVREMALGAYAHQDLPFEKLVEELTPERDMSRHPLFQITIALQNAPRSDLGLTGVETTPIEIGSSPVRFDLEVHLWEIGADLAGAVAYNTDLFDAATMAHFSRHFATLLSGFAADPDRRLAEVPLLSRAERHQIRTEWNDTGLCAPAPGLLHRLFEAQTEKTPDAVAVVFEGRHLTCRALDRHANRLARRLRALGVGPEVIVGICMDRRLELVVALLAILKAGGAFLPLDPSYPAERLAFMLEDSRAQVLLSDERWRRLRAEGGARILCPEPEWLAATADGESEPDAAVGADHPAYVLYTSGSTGRPKGVVISHRAISNHLLWSQAVLPLDGGDRVLQKTPLSFDASVWELWAPLVAGAQLVLARSDGQKDPGYLVAAIRAQRVTHLKLVPSLLALLVEEPGFADCRSLRRVLCGGESLPAELRDRQLATGPRVGFFNLYGPTEATIDATFAACAPQPRSLVPIGRPVTNTACYVLDPDLRPVPVGAPGELYVAGASLARGYLDRPRLTAQSFIPHPAAEVPGSRLYRTGDQVRHLHDGAIAFLGRLDHQVKVRGFRIELGEIEEALRRHPAVGAAVVVSGEAPGRGETAGHRRLIAYVSPAADGDGGGDRRREQISDWHAVFDQSYGQMRPAGGETDATFNVVGWDSSYTGQPIPAAEMREWIEVTVERILSLLPAGRPGSASSARVLEIGCGTGMVLFRVAPHCRRYLATDFSAPVLAALGAELPRHRLPQVTLAHRQADDFRDLPPGAFDLVVLNSVAQYFPSLDYLREVLRGAVAALAPGGCVFVGDVRSLPLLEAFCASVELFQADDSLPLGELRERIRRRRLQEEELVVDPSFFLALRGDLPRLRDVRILPRGGRCDNEMTRFRYDVVLRLEGDRAVAEPDRGRQILRWDWRREAITLAAVRRCLSARRPDALVLLGVPNRRVEHDVRLVEMLAQPAGGETGLPRTVGRLKELLRSWPAGVEPAELTELSREVPYAVELSWARAPADGSYDAVFRRRAAGECDSLRRAPLPELAAAPERPVGALSNDPARQRALRQLPVRLREHLASRLPEYMLPAAVVVVEKLPLSPSGKVDRAALGGLPTLAGLRPELEEAFLAPRTAAEKTLTAIWTEVLGVEGIGVHDNFFALGGDSILSIRIVARANQRGLRLTPKDCFQYQTVAELAAVVGGDSVSAAEQGLVTGRVPLTPIQRSFFDWDLPEPWHYNQSVVLAVRSPANLGLLRAALAALMRHHDALRLRFRREGSGWRQEMVAPDGRVPLVGLDLSRLGAADRSAAAEAAQAQAQASLELAAGPLLRAVYFAPSGRLLVAIHHLAVDAVSWPILLEDLACGYGQLERGEPVSLPPKTTSYKQWAQGLVAHAGSAALRRELACWRAVPRRTPPLPVDRNVQGPVAAGLNTLASRAHVSLTLERDETRTLLREMPAYYQTQVNEVLLTALVRAFGRWTGRWSLFFELEGHGREEIVAGLEPTRTVGWFTATFPVFLELPEAGSNEQALRAVGEQLRRIPQHGIGYGLLRYLCPEEKIRTELGSLPRPEVRFNYLGQLDSPSEGAGWLRVTTEPAGPTSTRRGLGPYLLEINGGVVGGRLWTDWVYSENLHRRSTVERLAQGFLEELRALVATC